MEIGKGWGYCKACDEVLHAVKITNENMCIDCDYLVTQVVVTVVSENVGRTYKPDQPKRGKVE